MKKLIKYVLYVVVLVVVVVGALLAYVKMALPDVGEAENITIEYTPQRIERGKYLTHAVSSCMDCHSTRDWSKFSGPLTEGTLGKGGELFDQKLGLPGAFYSKNITPSGINRYSDGELFRVITTGVTKEGRAMFPLMPYPYYGRMDREDIYSIISYVRSLAPIENEVPLSVADFPVNFIINTIPAKASLPTKPVLTDQVAYGAYLTNAAACKECHTQVDKGAIKPDLAFGGGREFKLPGYTVYSANISPDKETGIGTWTEEGFVQRFKLYADSAYSLPTVGQEDFQTVMPWTMYAQMTKEDLAAIFSYLKTVKPLSNKVKR
jgi:mono/diheme cytochrome c family protein